jgi:hypothetical protein
MIDEGSIVGAMVVSPSQIIPYEAIQIQSSMLQAVITFFLSALRESKWCLYTSEFVAVEPSHVWVVDIAKQVSILKASFALWRKAISRGSRTVEDSSKLKLESAMPIAREHACDYASVTTILKIEKVHRTTGLFYYPLSLCRN